MVDSGVVDASVLDCVISNGLGIREEAILWDFKITLPTVPTIRPDGEAKKALDAKFAEVVKDCVAFYNSHGGYIVAGISDATGAIEGYEGSFDAPDLNKRIAGATGVSIETIYRNVALKVGERVKSVGILFVPKRQAGRNPAQFKKAAPESPFGKKAYEQKDFYIRDRDTCRPAASPEDFEFLYGPRLLTGFEAFRPVLENNLPNRDPELSELRGRADEMTRIWRWLSDPFDPVHIICGLGGLGKTSLAYTFAERVIFNVMPELDRVVWLGAKSETFSGVLDRSVPLTRVDFDNIDQMLIEILDETGCPPDQIPEHPSREELLTLCNQHLGEFRYLLVIDNVDTLDDEEQKHVFHLVTQLCSMSRSKSLLTARKNLGASPAVYTQIEGIGGDEFRLLVSDKAKLLKIKEPSAMELEELHLASGGSPLFAQSLLRLVSLGDTFKEAIKNWKGSDGEAVRKAAFRREIGSLKANEARVLLALSYLQVASAAELSSVLSLSRYEVQAALEGLQSLSMTEGETTLPGGPAFRVPVALWLVSSLLEQRVGDWKQIKAECNRSNEIRQNQEPFVGQAITRTVALLRKNEYSEAKLLAREALRELPNNPDLNCLWARCLADASEPGAEEAFQKAFEIGCKKRDLFDRWIECRRLNRDWRGVIEVAVLAERHLRICRYCELRNGAQLELGDEQARAGRYKEASAYYTAALDDIKLSFSKYQSPSDRTRLRELSNVLAARWLGAVKMEPTSQADAARRLFGALHKAIVTYRYATEETLRASLAALSSWMELLGKRKELSDTTMEHMRICHTRLTHLISAAKNKPNLSGDFRQEFSIEALRLKSAIEALAD